MDDVLCALLAARLLLSDRNNWCRGTVARNKELVPVPHDHMSAVKWCAMGAIQTIAPTKYVSHAAINELDRTSYSLFHREITRVNDYTSYEAVLQVFDESIVRLEKEISCLN